MARIVHKSRIREPYTGPLPIDEPLSFQAPQPDELRTMVRHLRDKWAGELSTLDLIKELEARGLSSEGRKVQLVARLREAFKGEEEQQVAKAVSVMQRKVEELERARAAHRARNAGKVRRRKATAGLAAEDGAPLLVSCGLAVVRHTARSTNSCT